MKQGHQIGGRTMQDANESSINLEDAYALETPEDNRNLYRNWASTYDTDFIDKNRYAYPTHLARICASSMSGIAHPHILDVGCGTGIVGVLLAETFPTAHIDGVDISIEMLNVARSKLKRDGVGVYNELFEADLTQPITFSTRNYDALVSAGTFTHGHLGPQTLIDIIPLVKPGGQLFVGINKEHYNKLNFEAALNVLVSSKSISQPLQIEIQIYDEGSPHFGDTALVNSFYIMK